MLTFLSSVCSVSPEAAAASGAGLRKHWKCVVHSISPLLVHFKLSNSPQQKNGMIIRKTVLRNTDWVNLWMNLWKGVTKRCCYCYVSASFFKWVYANPWPSLVGIQRIPAYHVDYTTAYAHHKSSFSCFVTFMQSIMNICLRFPTFSVANIMLLKMHFIVLCAVVLPLKTSSH